MTEKFTESIVEDTALTGLNSDLPVENLNDLHHLTFTSLRDTLLLEPISDELQVKDAELFMGG